MIAPSWSNIFLPADTTADISGTENQLQAQKIKSKKFDGCGSYFTPTAVVVVTWADVIAYCEQWCHWNSWDNYYCYYYYRTFADKSFANVTSKALNNDTSLPTVDQGEKP
ncbi:hypothetical protein LSH36_3168g00002 [Paralvinella palmiformis]|uniref:Uncharacterized protein n=1 Tax=Paralvinella palmiformis TaxID=53620 RepID=A0AAD9IQ86_9ANNE|nr:hypothetical protein LSH36_3168g00002 [Paralvinella palmiformis]